MKTRSLSFPALLLDRTSRQPLHEQISGQIAQIIRSGELGRDTRLPSSRMLANLLGVSRNTVLTAYEELTAGDLIAGHAGSGMRVNAGPASGMYAIGLQGVIRNANFPAKTVFFCDPDGNPMYVNF